MYKLEIEKRIILPETFSSCMAYRRMAISLSDDKQVIFGTYDGFSKRALCFIDNGECNIVKLDGHDDYHIPVLLSVDNKVVLIIDERTLHIYDDYKTPPKIMSIENAEIIDREQDEFGHRMRLAGFPSQNICDDFLYPIILAEPVASGDTRRYAWLSIDLQNGSASWTKISMLDHKDFPEEFSEFEKISLPKPPTVYSLLWDGEKLLLFSAGSNTWNMIKWGLDFYCLADMSSDDRLNKWIWGEKDLDKTSKKLGVLGHFSSCGKQLILTHLFKSGDFQGVQKIYNLESNLLHDVTMPKGVKSFEIMDIYDDCFMLSDYGKTEIIYCKVKQ